MGRLSPLTIEIMLACYYSPEPEANFGDRRWNSNPARDARIWLTDQGLIDDEYRATEKGRFWVEEICSTPIPIEAYVPGKRGIGVE